MKKVNKLFYTTYRNAYPQDFHLKDYLRYYLLKYNMFLQIQKYITQTNLQTIHIADIGGGYGYDDTLFIQMLQHNFPQLKVKVDIFDPNINFYKDTTHSKQEGINYIQKSFTEIQTKDYTNKYDIIISSEVIEHLWTSEQEVFFANCNTILKMNGLMLITCPNGSSLLKNIRGLIQWKRKQYENTFMCEFNHRFAHIGIPHIFQALGLHIRKGFSLQKIIPTTFSSNIALNKKNIYLNKLFYILPFLNLFFSADNLFISTKTQELDTSKRYNTLSNH